jgi:hypothetical protein
MAKKRGSLAGPRTGVCERGRELIRQGKTNQQVITILKKEFRKSNTNINCVAWLRNDLRAKGEKIKTNRELTNAVTAAPKKATGKGKNAA